MKKVTSSSLPGRSKKPKRGDVFVARLDPAIGREIRKERSVIVVQANYANKVLKTTIVVPLTSQVKKPIPPFEVLISKKEGGLKKDSVAIPHQIRTLDTRRFRRKIGHLSLKTIKKVDKALKISLGLE